MTADSLNPTPEQGVQTAPSPSAAPQPPPEAPPIPLPPPPQPSPPSPERFLAWVGSLDRALVVVVVVFAFLAASFAATNSDFFLNAATGRLVAQGNYKFGEDPFTFTTEGTYWVNHSWLYSLLLYSLYSIPTIGGVDVVVVVKALLVAALAGLLIYLGHRPRQSVWIPAACTALAVLALSTRLYLQSICTSYLFLALTLYLLRRPRILRERSAGQPSLRAYWLIPVLCIFWVNFDNWFLLGPLTVGLYLLGEVLQEQWDPARTGPDASAPGELKTLALVFVASIAACLINPHHVHAFTLPYQLCLTGVPEPLQDDMQFRSLFLSPFDGDGRYFQRNYGMVTPAGMAYFPLLLVGLVSFGLSLSAWRWWRATLWLAFALLSAYHARAIPFFAVVAAPITALNFLDFAARRFGTAPRLDPVARRVSLSGRAATLLLGVLLAVAAVPGWLQLSERFRVAWHVDPDPGLREAAETILQWQTDKKVAKGTHWFNLSPEIVHYFAWFCPGERGFLDHRLSLFMKEAQDYEDVRHALIPEFTEEGTLKYKSDLKDCDAVFKKKELKYLVVYDSSRSFRRTAASLMIDSDRWPLLHYNGRVAIFGWRDVRDHRRGTPWNDSFEKWQVNVGPLAFGPDLPPSRRAPEDGMPRAPEAREWWEALWRPQAPRPLDADEALMHWEYFQAQGPRWVYDHVERILKAHQTAMAGMAAGTDMLPSGGVPVVALLNSFFQARLLHPPKNPAEGRMPPMDDLTARLWVRDIQWNPHLALQDLGPPAALYLSVRACRRSLAVNPDDDSTHELLGQVYNSLVGDTREKLYSGNQSPLTAMRQIQIAACLQNALQLNPNFARAHERLAELFEQNGSLDLSLLHRKEFLRIIKAQPLPGMNAKQYADGIAKLETQIKDLEKEVNRRRDKYEIDTTNKSVLERIQTAYQSGLVDKARELLEDPANLEETKGWSKPLILNIFLKIGQVERARELLHWIPPENTNLGRYEELAVPVYEWHQTQVAVGSGDYKKADEWLARMYETFESPMADNAAKLFSHVILREAPGATKVPWIRPLPPIAQDLMAMEGAKQSALVVVRQRTDLLALRGELALEAGDTAAARKHLREVLRLTGGPDGSPGVIYVPARFLATMWLEWLDEAAKEEVKKE
jgi:tetratricopeptide (TPR) repeat protein